MPGGDVIVTPAADARFVRVQRSDGQAFDVPADVASRLGLSIASAGGSPSASSPSSPSSPPADTSPAPAAPRAPSGLEAFVRGLGQQAPAPPAAPIAPPPQAPEGIDPTLFAAAQARRAQQAPAAPADAFDLGGAQQAAATQAQQAQQAQARALAQADALQNPGTFLSALAGAAAQPAPAELQQTGPAGTAFGQGAPDARGRPGDVFVSGVQQQSAPTQPGAAPTTAPRPRPRARAQQPTEPPDLVTALTQRPRDAAPLVPGDFRTTSPLEAQQQRIAETGRLEAEAANVEAVAAAERQDVLARAQAQAAQLEAERQQAMAGAQQRYLDAFNEARNTRVDPTRFYRDRGAAGTIGVAIATALGGIGAALTGGPNQALATIERAIDRDIEAQRMNQANAQANVGNARTFLDMTRQQFSDRAAAEDAARSLAWNQVAERAAQQAAQLRDEGARLRAQELQAEATARAQQAAQAAIQAQQDRELTMRQQMANIRKTEAEATRAERRAGMGGGGGGAALGRMTPEQIAQQAVQYLGMSYDTALEQANSTSGGARSGRQGLLRQIGEAQQRRGRLGEGYTLAPGRNLTDRQIEEANQLLAADAEFNAAIQTLRQVGGRLSGQGLAGYAWDQVAGRLGYGSEDYRAFNHAVEVIRTQFRTINDMGTSLGAQHLSTESFPDLTENLSIEAILRNAEAARQIKHRYVQSVLHLRGITPIGGEHEGGQDAAPPAERGGARRR